MRTDRITPENIQTLKDNEIFVFGSNEAGIHGAGAAKTALRWGAAWGKGVGQCGQTYAIPTKDENIEVLPLDKIVLYVEDFYTWAEFKEYGFTFLVTEIGCGYAGYHPAQIAPLFKDFMKLENVYLPRRFWQVLEGES